MSTDDLVKTLREQSKEIANKGIAGWGNTMSDAAEKIEQLQAALKEIRRKSERLDAQFYEIASRALDGT